MTTAELNRTMLLDEKEIAAAVKLRRQLTAFQSTKLKTQHIEILDDVQHAHTLQLPAFALRLCSMTF